MITTRAPQAKCLHCVSGGAEPRWGREGGGLRGLRGLGSFPKRENLDDAALLTDDTGPIGEMSALR